MSRGNKFLLCILVTLGGALLVAGAVARLRLPPAASVAAASRQTSASSSAAPTDTVDANAQLLNMGLVSDSSGWALAGNKLFWTDDDGANWRDASPSAPGLLKIENIFFLDIDRGWALLKVGNSGSATDAFSLVIASTTDRGRTWTQMPFEAATEADFERFGGGSITFVDPARGWLEWHYISGSSFSFAGLFSTFDGGRTWRKMPNLPTGGRLRFISHQVGWVAGGAGGDELYVTRDGGQTWQAQQLPVPQWAINPPASLRRPPQRPPDSWWGSKGPPPQTDTNPQLPLRSNMETPTFSNANDGLLPVTYQTDKNSRVVVYSTHDGGKTWQASDIVDTIPRMGGGSAVSCWFLAHLRV